MAEKLRPAVVLMDIAMPLLNGLEATRQVLRALPATKVLILSAHNDDAYVKNADRIRRRRIPAQTDFRPRRLPGGSGSRRGEKRFSALLYPGVSTASILPPMTAWDKSPGNPPA